MMANPAVEAFKVLSFSTDKFHIWLLVSTLELIYTLMGDVWLVKVHTLIVIALN